MIRQEIIQLITCAITACGYDPTGIQVTSPTSVTHGDYYTPIALSLAKTLKKNPHTVAEEIKNAMGVHPLIGRIDIAGPGFLNFWIDQKELVNILDRVNEAYGKTNINNGKKVVVEYSSPNIAKPFTIGHLRSTIIGDAVANLLTATGYEVRRDNHVGDWGTQFGKLIYAILTWGDQEKIKQSSRPVKDLVELYVRFHNEAERDPALEEKGRNWFKKLEEGDATARNLWQFCIDVSRKEFDTIYDKLDIKFDENKGLGYGESFFENKMQRVLEEIETTLGKQNLYRENTGAKLIFFPEEQYPPLMIIKQDGATLYSTRDLATDKFRLETYGKDVRIINEVGAEQSLYFNQLFEVERMLGWVKPEQRVHVKHGMYRFKEGKMSTRKGNVIWLEDVLEEAEKRAFNLIRSESIQTSPIEEASQSTKHSRSSRQYVLNTGEKMNVAAIVGIGAIKWNDLKRSSHLDIMFDWDEILKMDGNSGPYVQYTFVRCKSVLAKVDTDVLLTIGNYETETLTQEELMILRKIAIFPEVVADAAMSYAPNQLCTYLFELAQLYNLFYQKHTILQADTKMKMFRLLLTRATAHILQHGLSLLGIRTVEQM